MWRATQTEALAHALIRQLAGQPRASVLSPKRIVVAHSGLGVWLQQVLAVRQAPGEPPGIAANYRFDLPFEWLSQLQRRWLGESMAEAQVWRREALRWRIHQALPEVDDAAVRAFLDGAVGGARRFELADHLAGLYTQYLVYRRDWLAEAEHGAHGADWQARLWRTLVAAEPRPHRGQQLRQLLTALGRPPRQPLEPMHLFGLNHLPPDTWTVLRGVSRHAVVHLYLLDPVLPYWGDVERPDQVARRQLKASTGTDGSEESPHALVGALGRVGQQFNVQLAACEPLAEHDLPASANTAPGLLGRLQEGIQRLLPALTGVPLKTPQDWHAAAADASLRIHVCHTRLRELEVLRDALLHQLAAQPQLHPRDIVVMAPAIADYAALIPAVFGAPGAPPTALQRRLPYQLADRALVGLHPLLEQFDRLLELDHARITQAEVLDLLAGSAIARRLGVDAGGRATIAEWLAASRVAWALDGPMKTAFGAADEPRQTWSWALDRLFLGYLSGPDPDFEAFAGIHPLPGVTEPATTLLGVLAQLVERLASWREGLAEHRSLTRWSRWLEQEIEAWFVADPADDDESDALARLQAICATLAEEAARAGCDPELGFAEVRTVLRDLLAQTPERQRFLGGGITFCGMVPARVIPFEVVCLLGLNEGEFPRQPGSSGLNRIAQAPRPGDRDTRDEDQYLFLEALLSARSMLHLSCLGRDPVKDEPRNPAPPLAELLELLDREHGLEDAARPDRPWRIDHALQPFAPRYFPSQPAAPKGRARHAPAKDPTLHPGLFSYRERPAPGPARRTILPFVPDPQQDIGTAAGSDHPPRTPLPLRDLLAWLRDAPAFSLRQGLKLSLDALDERQPGERESLEPHLAALDLVPQRLFERLRRRGLSRAPATAPPWLAGSGLLPPGLPGEAAWATLQAQVDSALERLADSAPALLGATAERIPVQLDPPGLVGEIRAFRSADGCGWTLLGSRLGKRAEARHLLPLWAQAAVLRLLSPDELPVEVLLIVGDRDQPARLDPRPPDWRRRSRLELAADLGWLCAQVDAARREPAWWFPKTAWAWSQARDDASRTRAARAAWAGSYGSSIGERDYQPPYAGWIARGHDFLAPTDPAHPHFVELAARLAELVTRPA